MNKCRVLMLLFIAVTICFMSAVIGVADEVKLTLAGNYDEIEYARSITISGNYAYVADNINGLIIVDISNPTVPVLAGSYYGNKYVQSVTVSGNYAYIADIGDGLIIVDISNPVAPVFAGSYDTKGNAQGGDIAILGNYAYFADWSNGLIIVDISNPMAPVLAGNYAKGYAEDVAVSGNYAYIADFDDSLIIVDISNPTEPVLAGSYDTKGDATNGGPRGVAVSDNYAYIADSGDGLIIVDISNPAAPVLAGSYDTKGSAAMSVAISGNYAYVASNTNGLIIVDISNPTEPVLAGSYDTKGNAWDVAVSGNYAYVADNTNGLVVLNIAETGPIDVPIEENNPPLDVIIGAILILLIFSIVGIIIKKSNNPSKNKVPSTIVKPIEEKQIDTPIIEKQETKSLNTIEVKSAFSYKGATILYKIKVENPTPEPIGDIKVNLYVPDVFLVSESTKSIAMLKPSESKTATFEIRPTGECGDCEVSGKVVYYDYSTKKTSEIEIPAKNLSIVCPMLHSKEISEDAWRNALSGFAKAEESTKEIDMPASTLFDITTDILQDMNLYMLEPKINDSSDLYRAVAKFYGEGVKELKYAAQIEVVGGAKKSKLILKSWAEREDALTGFYHGVLDEIEKRVHVKGYINDNIVQHVHNYGDNIGTQVKDSLVQRSNIGTGTKKCVKCGMDANTNEKFCNECGTKFE